MTKYSVPNNIRDELENITGLQARVLDQHFRYPKNELNRDLFNHFNTMVSELESQKDSSLSEKEIKEQATQKLENQFENFMLTLDKATKEVEKNTPSKKLNDGTKPLQANDVNYATLRSKSNLEKASGRLQKIQKNFENSFKKQKDGLKEGEKLDHEKLLYEYLAKETKLIKHTANRRIGKSNIFQFAHGTVESAIKRHTNTFKKVEGQSAAKLVHNLREHIGHKNEKREVRREQGEVVHLSAIGNALENELYKKHEISDRVLDQLDLPSILEDRFHKLSSTPISIDKAEIQKISKEVAKSIKANKKRVEVGDQAAQLIYNNAYFDRTSALRKDFKERLGKKAIERTTQKETKANNFGMKAGIAGFTLSAIGGIVKDTSGRDAMEAAYNNDPELKAKAAKRQNRKLVFAKVAGIAGVALLLDGFLNQGKYTKQILDRFKSNGNDQGPSLS